MRKTLKTFLIGCVAVLAVGICSIGLQGYSPAPTVSSGCVGGPYYDSSYLFPVYFGKMDTIIGGATDTFKLSCGCKPTSIMFTNDQWVVSGTATVNVTCYASADGGASYASITSYSVVPANVYSVSAGAKVNQYLVNSAYGGNPYTNYMWVASNTAVATTTSVAWVGKVLVR